jgi:pyridoxine 5-phosphate synthase
VPNALNQITSDHGWNTIENKNYLQEIIKVFKDAGIRVSIFVDPVVEMVEGASATGTDRIELYTEGYAKGNKQQAIVPKCCGSRKGKGIGFRIKCWS